MLKKIRRADKVRKVDDLREAVASSTGLILTNYRGMTVAEMSELRKRLEETGCRFTVTKNTLLARALPDAPQELKALLTGPTAVAVCGDDPAASAKALLAYLRELRKPEVLVKGAYVAGRVMSPEGVTALSQLPPRPVVLGQALGAVQSPLSGFVGTLNAVLSEFVRTLQALADQRQQQPAA